MPLTETTTIHINNSVRLQAELSRPQVPPAEDTRLAVCLHPWSCVLVALLSLLLVKGYNVLRYNSRGVGCSSGRASFTGLPEAEDLQAVVQWALERTPNVRRAYLIGYSHGSLIASLHPVLPAPIQTSHLLLSYPVGPRSFLTLFHSSTYISKLKELIQHPNSRVLAVLGDHDEFTSASTYQRWRHEIEQWAESRPSGAIQVVAIAGATHFWRDESMEELQRTVGNWLE